MKVWGRYRAVITMVVCGTLCLGLGCGDGNGGNQTDGAVTANGGGNQSTTSGNAASAATFTPTLAISDLGNNRVLLYDGYLQTNQAASVVLGQPNFTDGGPDQNPDITNLANGPARPAANSLFEPIGLAKDSAGNLYVADHTNCRVLQFRPPFSNNMNASLVLGQPDFTSPAPQLCTNIPQSTASAMYYPSSVVFDHDGNLWITDSGFARVTEFVAPFQNGMAASLVIGQASMIDTMPCNQGDVYLFVLPTASSLCYPQGAAFDSNGDLWIADTGNSRVMEFVPPFSTGMAATLEIGQPADAAFSSWQGNNGGISSSTLWQPRAVTFDSIGNLWVADSNNGRVLGFRPPYSSGMAATLVIGAPDFIHLAGNASGFSVPQTLAFDRNGNLMVADNMNNRIMIYSPPFSSGMSANGVIGQTGLTSIAQNQGGKTPSANTLWSPTGLLPF